MVGFGYLQLGHNRVRTHILEEIRISSVDTGDGSHVDAKLRYFLCSSLVSVTLIKSILTK